MKHYELTAGVCSTFEQAIRFADWCESRPTAPNFHDVMHQFGVSRATAYNWLAAWHAARGTHAIPMRKAA